MILQHPAFLDKNLCEELLGIAKEDEAYKSVMGMTMCTYDFYEGVVTNHPLNLQSWSKIITSSNTKLGSHLVP